MTQFPKRSRLAQLVALALLAVGVTAIAPPPAAADGDPALHPAAVQPVLVGTAGSVAKPLVANRAAARTASRSMPAAAAPQVLTPTNPCGYSLVTAPGASPAGGYVALSTLGITPIAGVGDETNTTFTTQAFTFAGLSYRQLAVDSNGYVQVGAATDPEFFNQDLPDPVNPNNVIAPYWTDLDPGSAGEVRIAIITDGADSWIVVDWTAVREFSSAANRHSFEVWIGVDGDAHPVEDISFAYGPSTGNGDGGFLTVGAENELGTLGGTRYVDGDGTLPVNGDQLRVTYNGRPIAGFDARPTSGSGSLHVDFDASRSSDDRAITSYDWDFGDSTTGAGPTTSHDYGPGVVKAVLTVTDAQGNTCSTSQGITVEGGFSVDDVSVNEAAGTATFTVSRPGGPAASVDVAASAGSATTPADFTAAPTTLRFGPGETSMPYVVSIVNDVVDEPNESYSVALSNPVDGFVVDGTGLGTIVDDDPPVQISVNDANVTEGDAGTKNLTFQVRLNRASGKSVKVTFRTADGSAVAPSDYTTRTVVLTFAPGQVVKNVAVKVKGDGVREPNETFFVLLDSPVNASISDPSASGGIINDD